MARIRDGAACSIETGRQAWGPSAHAATKTGGRRKIAASPRYDGGRQASSAAIPHCMNAPVDVSFCARRKALDQLPSVLGQALWHGPVPANEPRRDGETGLGQLRHHPGHRRCVCGPPELRHGCDRPHARSARLSRGHHCPARLAKRRALQGAGQAQPVLGRDGGQHGFDDQPVHRRPEDPQR